MPEKTHIDSGIGYIDKMNGDIYIGSTKKFKPTLDWAKEKIELSLKSIGNRYITYNNREYGKLHQNISIQDYYEYVVSGNVLDLNNFTEKIQKNLFLEDLKIRLIQIENYVQSYEELKKRINTENTFALHVKENKLYLFLYNYPTYLKLSKDFLTIFESMVVGLEELENNRSYIFSNDFLKLLVELQTIYGQIHSNMNAKSYLGKNKFDNYSVEIIYKIEQDIFSLYRIYIDGLINFCLYKKISFSTDEINNKYELSTYLFKHSLVIGEAMSGKTHMLSDIANKRIHDSKPTILIYAQKFEGYATPIQHIVKQLGLESYKYTDEEFLELINNWGKQSAELVFLIVDAINETPEKNVWRNNFIEFVSMVKKYPYITLIMSIRDVEKRVIFTQDIENYVRSNMIEIEHSGFKEIEYPVLKKFCKVFDVNLPKFSLTSPIFANPGLMFLFFKTLKNENIVEIDEQVLKPNFIIEEYIKDRNNHFKETNNITDRGTYIHKGTNVIASKIVSTEFLEKVKYDDISNDIAQIHRYLLEYLISEGILLEQLGSLDEVYLYFSYQRFGNYFIALYLLTVDFEKNKNIIFNILNNYIKNQSLAEALIIRFSENEGKDFIDVFPDLFENEELNSIRYQCFSKSLKLPINIEKKLRNFITLDLDEKYEVLNLMLSFVYETKNKLNIEKMLHPILLALSMNERDYHWSIYVHDSFSNDGVVKHIIDWAWEKEEEYAIEDKSLYLYGLTLGWFLTSSNRELRDGATKALVNLFTNRVDIFIRVLQEFETVDDLYVLERLYAVAYGIVLRSSNRTGYKELGIYIYETIFNQNEIIEYILIRDYAKLTVEYIHKISSLKINIDKIYPPYNQHINWELPTIKKEDLKQYQDDYPGIYGSLLHGDFKIYVVYPKLNHFMNLKIKDRPHPKSPKQRYDVIINYKQSGQYEKGIDVKSAKRCLFLEVIKMGWRKEFFGEFDRSIGSHSRHDHITERIGKKYQWIALYQLLAKLTDHYEFREESYGEKISDYRGLYQLSYTRNIDPSTILNLKQKNNIDDIWWFNIDKSFEDSEISNKEWMGSTDKLPTIKQCINVKKGEAEFLIQALSFSVDGHKNKQSYRNLYYHIDAFIIQKDSLKEFIEWLNTVDYFGQHKLPQSSSLHEIHLKEYSNEKSFKYMDIYYRGQMNWDDSFNHIDGVIPTKILLTSTTSYMNEASSYDKSVKEAIEIKLPNKWFIQEMNLKQTLNDGEWIDKEGNIVFLDPTVSTGGITNYNDNGVLVSNKKLLTEFLEFRRLTQIWIVWGEKQVRSTKDTYDDKESLGFGEIMGYGYFDGDEFVEKLKIKYK